MALSSSVSAFDGLLDAEVLEAPETSCPDPDCSELPLPQPGEVEDGGVRDGAGVGMTGHSEGTEESMGVVGGVVRGGRGPCASRGPFNCDRGCCSSTKTQTARKK